MKGISKDKIFWNSIWGYDSYGQVRISKEERGLLCLNSFSTWGPLTYNHLYWPLPLKARLLHAGHSDPV